VSGLHTAYTTFTATAAAAAAATTTTTGFGWVINGRSRIESLVIATS
jgi:hypothetical protein